MQTELLYMKGITKIYPNGLVANADVTFRVAQGQIHAIAGENGAGKTTLMKVLFGLESVQEGEIFVEGEKVDIKSPLDAIRLGLGMVHQHFVQVPSMTVAENVLLGMEPRKDIRFDREEAVRQAQEISDRYNFQVDVTRKIEDISVGQRQKVEIMKALIRKAKIIILDEPTAVLTPQETVELFAALNFLKQEGHAIILITHKLEEIMQLCDCVTVMRQGRTVGTKEISQTSTEEIASMMIGRELESAALPRIAKEEAEDAVCIRDLRVVNETGKTVIEALSLHIKKGEIVGIAGVEGNGQKELADVLCGLCSTYSGQIEVLGSSIAGKGVGQIRRLGVAHIPEDRMEQGCARELSIEENLMATHMEDGLFSRLGFFRRKKVNAQVRQCIEDYAIVCRSPKEKLGLLSGGNIQKVIVARELSSGANFVVVNQPTRGVDIGASEMIHKKLLQHVEKGASALVISSNLTELLQISSRLLVMYKGSITAQFRELDKVDGVELGNYMLGVKRMGKEELGAL